MNSVPQKDYFIPSVPNIFVQQIYPPINIYQNHICIIKEFILYLDLNESSANFQNTQEVVNNQRKSESKTKSRASDNNSTKSQSQNRLDDIFSEKFKGRLEQPRAKSNLFHNSFNSPTLDNQKETDKNTEYCFENDLSYIETKQSSPSDNNSSENLYALFLEKAKSHSMTIDYFQYKLKDVYGDNIPYKENPKMTISENEKKNNELKFTNNRIYENMISNRPNQNLTGPLLYSRTFV